MPDPFAPPAGPSARAGSQRAEDLVPRDHLGRYLLPDPTTGETVPWRRVTTLAKALDDEHGLNEWKQRQAAYGVAIRNDLVSLAASVRDPKSAEGKATLRDVVEQAHGAAKSAAGRNIGVSLHTATERLDRGETHEAIGLPHPSAFDLVAYERFKRANGIVVQPEHIERICVWPELQVAGTLDRLAFWRGSRKVKDLKTGQDAAEHGQLKLAIQLTCYARAPLWWNLETQQYEQAPEIDQNEGMMLHLPSGQALPMIYRVNLAAGYIAAQVAYQVLAMRSQQRTLVAPYENVQQNPLDALAADARQSPSHPANIGPAAAPAPAATLAASPQQTVEQQIDAAFPLDGSAPAPAGGPETLPPGVPGSLHPEFVATVTAVLESIPGPVRRAILEARTQDQLAQLYTQGTAAGMWSQAMTDLGFAVTAAHINPCDVTKEPHGDTLACGCGYRRPDLLLVTLAEF